MAAVPCSFKLCTTTLWVIILQCSIITQGVAAESANFDENVLLGFGCAIGVFLIVYIVVRLLRRFLKSVDGNVRTTNQIELSSEMANDSPPPYSPPPDYSNVFCYEQKSEL